MESIIEEAIVNMAEEENKPVVSEQTEKNAQKYFRLMADFKKQLKILSHNELARQYVALYSQHVLLQKLHDDLKATVSLDFETKAQNPNQPENQ